MNEYIEVRFRRNNKPLRIKRQVPEGIELDEPDPIQRTVSIGFDAANEITEYRVRRIRQLQDWDPGQFKLLVSVEDGTLVLRGVDPHALPEGRYTVRVRLEEAKTRQQTRMVDIDEDSHAVLVVDVETDDRDVAVDLGTCDPDIRRVLDASSFDGEAAEAWLDDDDWRPAKKACLLNLLASLRVRPTLSAPLIDHVQSFYEIRTERAYAKVDPEFLPRLEELAKDPKKPFYREGAPKDSMHKKLIESIPKDIRPLFSPDRLLSFRGETRAGGPSLQAVVAVPPAGSLFTFADIDLDLGNPLQDVAGFIVHMGELVGGDPTNHLDLRKKLAKTSAGIFLYYKVA
jgi:hypothetical protein